MQPHNFFSTDATPSHSSRKNLILNSKKSPASTQEVSESENRPATRGTAHSEVQGDARCTTRCTTRCTARCNVRPMAALHFLPPTGHSPSGSSFDSKLISLLPLDEVPVHVPLRRPRPLRFERLRVGGEGKADANLTNFLSTCCAWHPNSPPRPGGAPHPAPSARKSATQTAQKTALCAPCEHPGGSESENRPATRGTAHSEV